MNPNLTPPPPTPSPNAALTRPQHTRQHLESLHPTITFFRHPEQLPTGLDRAQDLGARFRYLTLNATGIARASTDALKAIYGTSDGMVLFWAHHEKLCVVDERVVFMGGLDMCKSSLVLPAVVLY